MSQSVSFILTIIPIVAILLLLVVWRKPADLIGVIGWLIVAIIAYFFYNTGIEVILRSSVAGLLSSFAVSLIVATSLLQISVMQKTGALQRIIVFLKTISSENRAVSIMIVNIGFGILMVSVGATPVSILPPILLALGYTVYSSIALPAIGYDALCTYALLGAPIVVFVDIANKFFEKSGIILTLSDVGRVFNMYLPIVSILIGFSMLWIVGRGKEIKKGILPVIVTGIVIGIVSHFTSLADNLVPLTGVFCGVGVIIAMILYLKLTGKKIIDRSKLTSEDIEIEKKMPLWRAFMPWILLIIIIVGLNVPKEMFDLLYTKLALPITGLTADGSPIKTRALWNAYTWIFVSTLLSLPFLRVKKGDIGGALKIWIKRAPRPVFAAAIFFAIGSLMQMTGYNMLEKAFVMPSMVKTLADVSAAALHGVYQYLSSFIGLLGGFITGSEASTIGMFGTYVLTSAKGIGFDTNQIILTAAALAFGGGLASVISPAKLQNAAAAIDRIGEEHKVIRMAFLIALLLTLITSLVTGLFMVIT